MIADVAGRGSVIDGSVAARDKSLFNTSASSDRKNVVVFPDGASVEAFAAAVVAVVVVAGVLDGTVRGSGVTGIS